VHCDGAYGFGAPCVNVVVPLTASGGAAALHVESAPGAEDWHVLTGAGEGALARFWGARCLHWTGENARAAPLVPEATRASLDLRVLWGEPRAGARDRFEGRGGFFATWRADAAGAWAREGALPPPDERCGYPFAGLRGGARAEA
jgi:hypothetical protein